MLSDEISNRLDRLLVAHDSGVFGQNQICLLLGDLVTADNFADVLERIPPQLKDILKASIQLDNQMAAQNECLHAECSPFGDNTISRYYSTLASLLLARTENKKCRTNLGVVCLPSFEPEWAIRLFRFPLDQFHLNITVAENQIWSLPEPSLTEISETEKSLDPKTASALCDTWAKMLGRTKMPLPSGFAGCDGVRYHFWSGPGGWMAGTTWSPKPTSAPGRLVELSHLLRDYVSESGEQSSILSEINRLMAWFRDLY